MKATILLSCLVILITSSLSAMNKRKIILNDDETVTCFSMGILKKCRVVRNQEADVPDDQPLDLSLLTRKEFTSLYYLMLSHNKSEETLKRALERKKPRALADIIRIADCLECPEVKRHALATLINKLKDNPRKASLLSNLSRYVGITDLPEKSIKELKEQLLDQLSNDPKADLLVRSFDHGERIKNIVANDRFVVTQSNTIVTVFEFDKESPLKRFDGDFRDVALSDNNCLAIGYKFQ